MEITCYIDHTFIKLKRMIQKLTIDLKKIHCRLWLLDLRTDVQRCNGSFNVVHKHL